MSTALDKTFGYMVGAAPPYGGAGLAMDGFNIIGATPLALIGADLDEIGATYVSALAGETIKWLQSIPETEPIGVGFSGGIDSGAVFVLTIHCLRRLGMNPARLKAFTLDLGGGDDLRQARTFLERLDLALFHESIEADPASLDPAEGLRYE